MTKKQDPVPVYLRILRKEDIILEAVTIDDAVAEARELGFTVVMADFVPLDVIYEH